MREMLTTCHLCDHSPVQQEKGYSSLQDEAVKIFNSLQEIETVSDPIPIIQGILQTCHDLKPLRDEVYCQLIKQTNHMPHPNSTGNLHHWQLMSCMSCTFLPSRGILRYLKFHLRRYTSFSFAACFLSLCLSSTACCSYLSRPPPVQTSSCGVAASYLCALFLLPVVLLHSNSPLATHLLCEKDVESKATQTEYRETVLKVDLQPMNYCLLMSI